MGGWQWCGENILFHTLYNKNIVNVLLYIVVTFLSCILSSVCRRWSLFSPLPCMQYIMLCIINWPISLVMITRIFVLHLIIIVKSTSYWYALETTWTVSWKSVPLRLSDLHVRMGWYLMRLTAGMSQGDHFPLLLDRFMSLAATQL